MIHCKQSFIAATIDLVLLAVLLSCAVAVNAEERNFLWKVSSAQNNLHILGSIHLLKRESYPLKKIIEETFDSSNKLVLEIDLQSAKSEKIQQLALQKGMNSDGVVLQQKVSKQTYEMVVQRAKELGLDIRLMSPFKPWMVAMAMATMNLEKLGFDPSFGIDRYLASRAEQTGKPIEGLETAEFQIGLFDQFSARDQELLLRQSMSEMDHLAKNVDRIVQAWKTGDTTAVEKMLFDSMRDFPEIQVKIIDDRNRRWMPRLEDLLSREHNALVVVGAAHLVGKNGVIELLKRRGYRVEQQ